MRNIMCAIALLAWSGCALAHEYTVTRLGLLPGGTYAYATAINNADQVVAFLSDELGKIPNMAPTFGGRALGELEVLL